MKNDCFSSSWSLLPLAILSSYVVIMPYCFRKAHENSNTREILYSGWTPVLSAMVISSMGGKILNGIITRFPDIAVFQVTKTILHHLLLRKC